jgi:mono/diheme cytochrome c family protein
MPAFPWMLDDELEAVIDYVILLSQRGEVEEQVAQAASVDYDEDEEIDQAEFIDAISSVRSSWERASSQITQPVTPEPPFDRASVLAGRQVFVTDNCWKCHGTNAKGQTEWLSHEFLAEQASLPADQQVQINRDVWGNVAPAADLTARMLHGGRRPIDIYRRIYTGINGTPMPSFASTFASDPDKIWHLVHYVLSIVEGGEAEPEVAESQIGK